MPLLPYDYLHLVNCPEVVTISDNYCTYLLPRIEGTLIQHSRTHSSENALLRHLVAVVVFRVGTIQNYLNPFSIQNPLFWVNHESAIPN